MTKVYLAKQAKSTIEYTDCISAEGKAPPHLTSEL